MPIKYSSQRESEECIVINSCGERFLDDRDHENLREKGRIDFGLQFVESGRCFFEDNGVVREAEAGSVLLHFPNVRQHYFFKQEDKTHLMWMHFTGVSCSILDKLKSNETVHIKLNNPKQFKRIFEQMVFEFHERKPHYKTFCEGGALMLLSMLLRNEDNRNISASKQSHRLFSEVISHMNIYFERPLDIDLYAKMCFVNRYWFIHKFKAYTGMSPSQYLLNIRMDKAKELLEYSKLNINEIAEHCGYNSCSYFCKTFKSFTGQTPNEYRKG